MSFPFEFRILGTFEVTQRGRPIQLGGRQQQALLARLLLDANHVVSVDRLVDGLWGETAPASAVKMVHIHVSQLRKALGSELVLTQPPGYLLAVPPEAIDAQRFTALRERGAQALKAGDPQRAAEDLAAALAMWGGSPLEGFPEDFATAEAARLEELRLLVLEDRIQADLALGRHGGLVPELEALATGHPLRERFREQLMLALYRCGRQADALEAYRRHREHLDAELGLRPSPVLVDLEQRILQQDPGLDLEVAEAPAEPALPAPVVVAPARAGGQRRRLAVLVCDLRSTHDPEDLAESVARFAAIAEAHGGMAARPFGTRAMAYFNYPRVYEDATARAVRAGLEAVEAVGRRAAVDSGRSVVGDVSGEVVGEVISEAAALADAASEGTVVVGEAAAALVGAAIDLERDGDGAWVATGVADLALRTSPAGHGPFVGRTLELAILADRWERAAAGTGQVVLVSGGPGIGKSRLCDELVASLDGEFAKFSLRCAAERVGSPYFPLANELGRCLGVSQQQAGAMSDLETAASVFGMTDADAVPVLSNLLGMPGEGPAETAPALARRHTLAALSAWFPAVAQSLPTLVVAEDLQWADPSTLEFLGMLVDEAPRSRLLIVATARPEFRTPWLGRSHVAAIALDRLSEQETATLVRAQGPSSLSEADRNVVIARSDGVPLFAEELAKALGASDGAELPEALEDVLLARLERLGEARNLALIGAVLGRDFSYGEIARVSSWTTDALDEALDVLVEQEVLHQRSQPPYSQYVFRHALVRDAAYATLLAGDRRDLHARAGAALRDVAPPEVLAHHLALSGADGEAVDAWLAAAGEALSVNAFAEAREHAAAALAALDRLPAGDDANLRRDRVLEVLDLADTRVV